MKPDTAAIPLRSRLVRRLLPLQAGLLGLLALLLAGSLWMTGLLLHQRDEDRVIEVVSTALGRDAGGALVLHQTVDLHKLQTETPGLWFLIRDRSGDVLKSGHIPPEFAAIGNALDGVGQAKLGWERTQDKPQRRAAQMKRVDTDAGNVQIIAATDGPMPAVRLASQAGILFLGLTLPSLAFMTLATLVATPIVVRRALSGLDEAADRAREIDIDKRGTRLPLKTVPAEVVPLVSAVNDALGRLDDGYERHRRFLADAAHELRTPIAILTTRLETLPAGDDKRRLMEDAARVGTLTEQLLDLERIERNLTKLAVVDLVEICAKVVADLAPMAIAAGYEISLQHDATKVPARGDRGSLERAVINLVQNAIQHGGRNGTILVSVQLPATIEVSDQGPGIPQDARDQVFEPFHRLAPLSHGAGLGLNLVREIVRLHDGNITILDSPDGGACFQMTLTPTGTIKRIDI